LRAFIRKTDIAHGHRANRRVGVLGQRVASLLGALGAPGLAVRAAVGLRATLERHHGHHRTQRLALGLRMRDRVCAAPREHSPFNKP
jgi:hypothetical protein